MPSSTMRSARPRGRPRHPDVLTPAERRVLTGVRRGRTNPEIAERDGTSVNTVRTRVSHMLDKLGLEDREALSRWAAEQNPFCCSFWAKKQQEVDLLVAGPGGVYICDECVAICNQYIAARPDGER